MNGYKFVGDPQMQAALRRPHEAYITALYEHLGQKPKWVWSWSWQMWLILDPRPVFIWRQQ